MADMSDTLHDMVNYMQSRKEEKAGKQPSATKLQEDPQERAIAILQKDAPYSDNELMDVVDIFMADCDFTRVYATLDTSRMHTIFLQRRLKKALKKARAESGEETL